MITTADALVAALGAADAQRFLINKGNVATQQTSGWTSLWRATGIPAQGAIPGAAAIPTKATTGALLNFTNADVGEAVYLAKLALSCSNASSYAAIVDRVGHMGGLSGVTTGAQTVSVDPSSLKGDRIASDMSDVSWWAEIYIAIGTTAQTCTVTYTRDSDGTTGRTTTFTLGGASPANQPGRLLPIYPIAGETIRSIESVSISVSTGTAGSWGITALKYVSDVTMAVANAPTPADWAALGFPAVVNDACLQFIMFLSTTSSGTLQGGGVLVTG